MCKSNSFDATAAHKFLNDAFVGCPRFKLQRIALPRRAVAPYPISTFSSTTFAALLCGTSFKLVSMNESRWRLSK